MDKVELLRYTVNEVEKGVSKTAGIVELLEQNGIVQNMHVGQPKEFFEDKEKLVEYYLGQYIDIINKKAWFAMNSAINITYVFLQEQKDK